MKFNLIAILALSVNAIQIYQKGDGAPPAEVGGAAAAAEPAKEEAKAESKAPAKEEAKAE